MSDERNRIKILPDSLIDVIAAGEVVERPASVVKELVENALDAGAKTISVRIADGGRKLVQVIDDGCGMDEENALLAIERHATSKIEDLEDLRHIRTLGFRGEALPSIAAVGRFTIETWDGQAPSGTRVVLDGGRLLSVEPCGRGRGTTVSLEGIFRRVPARRKFLRTRETEAAWCAAAVEDAALAHPEVSFSLASDGVALIAMPPASSLRDRVAALWGVETAERLLPLVFQGEDGVSLSGLISPPTETYPRRLRHRVTVNGRPVRDPVLNRVVSSALAGSWPAGRFPALVLDLQVTDDLVDVNVHPAKREVRLSRTEPLAHGLREAVRKMKAPVKASLSYAERASERGAFPAAEGNLPMGAPHGPPGTARREGVPDAGPGVFPEQEGVGVRILGQVMGTYLLAEGENGLQIIDQHAAHERIVFNRLMAGRAGGGVPVQRLAVPLVLTLSPSETGRLLAAAAPLTSFGFEIEPFGPDTVRVTAVPSDLKGSLIEDLLRQMAAGAEPQTMDPEDVALAVSRWACRQSVMAGRRLSPEEMARLVRDLDEAEAGFSCPHGRPTRVTLGLTDLEKLFGRR